MTKHFKELLLKTDYSIKNAFVFFIQKLLFKRLNNREKIKKIIIFRTGSIGDSICAIPALSVIRNNFPDALIDILTNSGSENNISLEALIDNSKFNEIINYFDSNRFDLRKKLKAKRYDLFIDLTQYDATLTKHLKVMMFAYSLRVRSGFGWRISQSFLFSKFQESNRHFLGERERLLSILGENGLDISRPSYIVSQDDTIILRVAEIIKKAKLRVGTTIGIVIGSKLERNKWPLSSFKQVIEHFTGLNCNVFIFGGSEDKENAGTLILNKLIFNFCGKFTPLETAEAMKSCSVIITNDTGPMHLAYMMKTPVVAIFSSRDFPGKWFPPEDGLNKVFRSENVACSICFGRACSDNICMKMTNPEMVIKAVLEVIPRLQ